MFPEVPLERVHHFVFCVRGRGDSEFRLFVCVFVQSGGVLNINLSLGSVKAVCGFGYHAGPCFLALQFVLHGSPLVHFGLWVPCNSLFLLSSRLWLLCFAAGSTVSPLGSAPSPVFYDCFSCGSARLSVSHRCVLAFRRSPVLACSGMFRKASTCLVALASGEIICLLATTPCPNIVRPQLQNSTAKTCPLQHQSQCRSTNPIVNASSAHEKCFAT